MSKKYYVKYYDNETRIPLEELGVIHPSLKKAFLRALYHDVSLIKYEWAIDWEKWKTGASCPAALALFQTESWDGWYISPSEFFKGTIRKGC